MVGNEDPDAGIPESGTFLAGHEPQHRTHGSHHEPEGIGGGDSAAPARPSPDTPSVPESEPAKDTVRQRAANQEDVDPKKKAQD